LKIFNLDKLSDSSADGEVRLDAGMLGSSGQSLVYLRLRPGETSRTFSSEPGHDAIVCMMRGRLDVRIGRDAFSVSAGEAFHLDGSGPIEIDNTADEEAVFIAATSARTESAKEAACEREAKKPEAGGTHSAAPQGRKNAPDAPEEEDEQDFEIHLDDDDEEDAAEGPA